MLDAAIGIWERKEGKCYNSNKVIFYVICSKIFFGRKYLK
jgi:hypothetical protein